MISENTINQLKQGNAEAFNDIFKEYSNLVFYLALKYTKNSFDADDLVQEIFIKLLRNIHKFDGNKASFGTWLYIISKNTILDYLKSKQVYNSKISNDENYVEHYIVNENVFDDTMLSKVEAVIGTYAYHILILKKGYLLTFEEIANELNTNPSKIKRIYYQTLEKIEKEVK